MINFNSISTLLFDIDNTLLLFNEREFISIYIKGIHNYFRKEIENLEHFGDLFVSSTQMMLKKNPNNLTNLSKFLQDFSDKIKTLTADEIRERFLRFYQNEFNKISRIVKPHPIAKPLLTLAQNNFILIAATNPLYPSIANELRLSWGKIDSKHILWQEITSADNYHHAKPSIEYYQEILERIQKKPSECIMIGNDPINDMIASKLGIITFLVNGDNLYTEKVIETPLDHEKPNFFVNYKGTLEDFYNSLKIHKEIINK